MSQSVAKQDRLSEEDNPERDDFQKICIPPHTPFTITVRFSFSIETSTV